MAEKPDKSNRLKARLPRVACNRVRVVPLVQRDAALAKWFRVAALSRPKALAR